MRTVVRDTWLLLQMAWRTTFRQRSQVALHLLLLAGFVWGPASFVDVASRMLPSGLAVELETPDASSEGTSNDEPAGRCAEADTTLREVGTWPSWFRPPNTGSEGHGLSVVRDDEGWRLRWEHAPASGPLREKLQDCVRQSILEARQDRVREVDLGAPAARVDVILLDALDSGPRGWRPTSETAAPALLLLLALVLTSGVPERMARLRDSGFVQTLQCARSGLVPLVASLVLENTLLLVLALAIGLPVWMRSGVPVDAALLTLPVGSAVAHAVALRSSLHVTTATEGSRTSIVILFGLAAWVAVVTAIGAYGSPWVAACLPGAILAAPLGVLGPALPVAVLLAAPLIGWLGWDATRWLSGRDLSSADDATLRRRAQGDYRPEALLLWLLCVPAPAMAALPGLEVSSSLIVFLLFLVVPAWSVADVLGLDRRELLGLVRPSWTVLLGALALGVFWVPVSLGIGSAAFTLLPPSVLTDALVAGLSDLSMSPSALLVLVFLPAFAEELALRGAILGLLRQGMAGWTANVLQALGFALLHGHPGRWPGTFVLGLVLGGVRARTGSVWPCVVIHLAHNGLLVWMVRS